MKNKIFLIFTLLIVVLLATNIHSKTMGMHCHFSLVDGEVYVIKPDQNEIVRAIVNYPLIPGDIIYTNGKGRCELQFSNGSLMRMDGHTELQITSILSPTLTSNFKITTLTLKKGQVFTMNQIYKKEIFQINTPLASIKMNSRSTSHISIDDTGETGINVIRGKIGILYDQGKKVANTEYLKARKSCIIGEQGFEIEEIPRTDPDFVLWNREINKNFRELHYGKSNIPSVIYRRSPGIVHFAEKFSSLYGTWEYNDLFGYVWKPADFVFHELRPFFDANYMKINGELVLVPNQAWGWAPAHLGTWFWSKTDGWIWIPGDAFSRDICATGLKDISAGYWVWVWYLVYPQVIGPPVPRFILNGTIGNWFYFTPEYWINRIFGSLDLYHTYRQDGKKAWRQAYRLAFNHDPFLKKPDYRSAPENIRRIIRGLDRVSEKKMKTYFSENKINDSVKFSPNPVRIIENRIPKDRLPADVLDILISRAEKNIIPDLQMHSSKKDWNPDSSWAQRLGVNLIYSSRRNQVICPELGLGSRELTGLQRFQIKRSISAPSFGNENPQSFPQNIGAGTSQPSSQSLSTTSRSESGSHSAASPTEKQQ